MAAFSTGRGASQVETGAFVGGSDGGVATAPPKAARRSIGSKPDRRRPGVDEHDREQADHGRNFVTKQSTGQECLLHCSFAAVTPHTTPPCCGALTTLLDRLRDPDPHVLEHLDHRLKALSTQSTGHAILLHSSRPVNVGHGSPPARAGVAILLERKRAPEPQLLEHLFQVLHPDTSQLAPQPWVLHFRFSELMGQALPPY